MQKSNKELYIELEKKFKPLGIIACSLCCRLGCTGSYDEYDKDFIFNYISEV
jgi:hypothetical protein